MALERSERLGDAELRMAKLEEFLGQFETERNELAAKLEVRDLLRLVGVCRKTHSASAACALSESATAKRGPDWQRPVY